MYRKRVLRALPVKKGGQSGNSVYALIASQKGECTMTKGDNIRRMLETDEGIADFLIEHGIDDAVSFCRNRRECDERLDTEKGGISKDWCRQCLIKWLEENHVENKD